VLAGCGADAVVTTQRADQIATESPPTTAAPDDAGPPGSGPGADDAHPTRTTPADDQASGQDPAAPGPDSDPDSDPGSDEADPATTAPVEDPDPAAIDFGPDKPAQEYDELLLATVTDLEAWWSARYPEVYGESFTRLQGRVYAAYRSRPGDLPGCGQPRTTYNEVRQFVAFYCGEGDFIIYDDGDSGLLAQLADNFGPATIGVVLAHEYGHAVQLRTGALQRSLPTVTTEQQADCFAGAWAGRAARGSSPWVRFTDDDVRAGLIAMLEVRDPVGIDQFTPGGHGSGFDRVGAFQVGFLQGLERCATLLDDPLPLMPNEFTREDDFRSQGNAPFGYADDELFGLLPEDLNLYWDVELDAEIPGFDGLALVPVDQPGDIDCSELRGRFDDGVVLCPDSSTVYLNEPVAFELYQQASTFGDFSIGYLLGTAWAEAVQIARGSELAGEPRALRNDCLAGAWVRTVIPVGDGLPEPRVEERRAQVSPGDLDEAVRTVILIGDSDADDDVIGSPFEKIDAFREGVLGGLEACGF
jgi:predicted metalloprotease